MPEGEVVLESQLHLLSPIRGLWSASAYLIPSGWGLQ